MSGLKYKNMYWKSNPGWEIEFKDVDDEEYKPIHGYHGAYFISNYGKVISFKKRLPFLLCNSLNGGFLAINLAYKGVYKFYFVHDLVYTHFVGEPEPGHRVMHKNNIVIDNHYRNLYAVSTADLPGEIEKFYDLSRLSIACLANLPETFKTIPVLQFTKKGKFVREYSSIFEAARRSGATPEGINGSIRGYQKCCKDFQWRLKDDDDFKSGISAVKPVKYKNPVFNKGRTVCQFDRDGKFIREYPSCAEAARQIGVSRNGIHLGTKKKIKCVAGFQWRLKNDVFKDGKIMDIEPVKIKRKIKVSKIKVPKKEVSEKKVSREKKSKHKHRSYPNTPGILQFHLEGMFLKEYGSTKIARERTGISSYYITKCIKGDIQSAGGFQWRLKDDPLFINGIADIDPVEGPFKKTPLLKFDFKGKYVNEYPFVEMAAAHSMVNTNSVIFCLSRVAPTAGGFQWRLKSDPMFKKGIVNIPPVDVGEFKISNRKPILQFSRDGKFFRAYPNTTEAARVVGTQLAELKQALRGKKQTAGGFQWRYFNDPLFKDDIVDIEPAGKG